MTTLDVNTGSEGPKHDPYSFEELVVTRGEKRVVFHRGLIVWVKVDGKKVAETDDDKCEQAFAAESGLTYKSFQKAYLRVMYTCKECGCRRTVSQDGHPGETFNVCARCKAVVSTNFNANAVM